jgi:hypothetical protein
MIDFEFEQYSALTVFAHHLSAITVRDKITVFEMICFILPILSTHTDNIYIEVCTV